MDPIAQFKEHAKKAWSTFAPTEFYTCQPAARLVGFARIGAGQRVLDVACGTGPTSLAAARIGAKVTGLDLTPQLLDHAKENAAIAGAQIEWEQGDVESMPFEDASFDVVISQFGHMFAPRPELAVAEMLRVLRPGGTIAFSTWPPELYVGRLFGVIGRYAPPPPEGVAPPPLWGIHEVVRERLGDAVTDLHFDRFTMRAPALSPQHIRHFLEASVGPIMTVVQLLGDQPEKLATFRAEIDGITMQYFEPTENILRQDYLMTRAIKVG